MSSPDFRTAFARTLARLNVSPAQEPVLIILSGLPGTGKSTLARHLAQALPAVVVESDLVRKTVFPQPTHSGPESQFTHTLARALIRHLLKTRHIVIADATHLVEWHRQLLTRVALDLGVPVLMVEVTAPPDVVRRRLSERSTHREPGDLSDATWDIYEKMVKTMQPIRGRHLVVDSGQGLDAAIKRIARAVNRARRPRSLNTND